MRLTQLSMALAVAISASTAVQAQQFSSVISFGDSLTDAGNVALIDGNPITAPGSSWTTNPDSVHAQLLTGMLGLGSQTNSLSGGTNYAYGGACVIKNGTATLAGAFNCYRPFPSVTEQVVGYLTAHAGHADPHAVYTLWGGGNDVLTGAGISSGVAQAYAGQAGVTAATLAGNLLSAGAKTVVVFNLPDLGITPLNVGTASAAGASALSAIYNMQLNGKLATLSDGIVAINTFAFINEAIANPSAYGFTNVTGKACGTGPGVGGNPSSVACGPAGSGLPWTYAAGTNNTYLFADDIHPTGAAHQMLANVVYATLTAPGIISLAPEVALQSAFAHNASINEALDSEWAAGSEVGKVRGFSAIQIGQQNSVASDFTPSLDGDSLGLNIGATYRMSEDATFGVAASLGNTSADAGTVGSFDGSSVLFGIFGQYEVNGLYGRASLSGGNTDMDIRRFIPLGPNTRRESGNTGISHQSGAAEVGYVFKADHYTHGPYASVEVNKANVSAYTEDGTSSTAMHFDKFNRDSNMTRVGYQFSGTFANIKPFVRIAWVNETNKDQVLVRAGTASMPGNFVMPGFTPSDDNYIDWNIGASMRFADSFDGFISYRAMSGNSQQDQSVINLGIRKTF
jgi:outer membrane lipase/esterase